MRKKIIMGNWKMNGSAASIVELLTNLKALQSQTPKADSVVFPPSIYIPLVQSHLTNTSIAWGAQNVYPKDQGAYTGEVSAPMLKDFGCRYVLVGHSERRQLFHETENFVANKFHHVKDHDMIPVLCVGETEEQRQQGLTEQVLSQQLDAVAHLNGDAFKNSIVAYEPVWSIGTGKTASLEQVQAVHHYIRGFVAKNNQDHAEVLQIIYGGSVTADNAAEFFKLPDVDGVLVGGASLNAQSFVDIIKCTN